MHAWCYEIYMHPFFEYDWLNLFTTKHKWEGNTCTLFATSEVYVHFNLFTDKLV